MTLFLNILKKRRIFFLDSKTTADTVACDTAASLDHPCLSRDIFIDQGAAGGDVKENLRKLTEKARKQGYAVGIGHARRETLDVVVEEAPGLIEQGFQFVHVTDILNSSP